MQNSAAAVSSPLPPSTVSWIRDKIVDLTPPPDHSVSVLLREVGYDGGHTWYAWWAAAGRDGVMTARIEYRWDAVNTIRIDVPRGQPISSDYLQTQLDAFWEEQLASDDPPRPQDPPIIKH